MRKEVELLFNNPPVEAPEPSDEVKLDAQKSIEFEQEPSRLLIKKWIKEDGMEKQDAKDRFQAGNGFDGS